MEIAGLWRCPGKTMDGEPGRRRPRPNVVAGGVDGMAERVERAADADAEG